MEGRVRCADYRLAVSEPHGVHRSLGRPGDQVVVMGGGKGSAAQGEYDSEH